MYTFVTGRFVASLVIRKMQRDGEREKESGCASPTDKGGEWEGHRDRCEMQPRRFILYVARRVTGRCPSQLVEHLGKYTLFRERRKIQRSLDGKPIMMHRSLIIAVDRSFAPRAGA